jgi:hypothetical protein
VGGHIGFLLPLVTRSGALQRYSFVRSAKRTAVLKQ